ncbi:hypothetical protein AIIKEEIJ_02357 [Rhodococcus sp. YH1]|nr:hypothetical protein [Rhodococcus sp. YH1]
MLRPQRREPVGVGQRRVAVRRGVGLVERHDRHRVRTGQAVPPGPGENQDGRGGFEDVRDPVRRLVRVERDVSGPGGEDRVDRHEHLRGAAGGHRDHRVRSRAARDEIPRQRVDPGAELAVGQRRLTRLDRHGVGGAGRLLGEEIDQRGPAVERAAGPPRELLDRVEFRARQHRQVADRHVGLLGHQPQQPDEPVADGGHGRGVEQVGGVGDLDGEVARVGAGRLTLEDRDHEVELRHARVEGQLRDGQPRQFQGHVADVLERQHDLEQRSPGLGAFRREHVHETLERHLGVREGPEVDLAHPGEQFGEGVGRVHLGAQHQGVDEHADQIVERAFPAAGHRGADGDVPGRAEAGQQQRQGRVDHHEHRRALFPGEPAERGVQRLVDGEAMCRTTIRRDRGPRPVGRQVEPVRQSVERLLPVLELTGDDGVRVALGAEHVALPQGVVGVLDLQRLPGGLVAERPGRVGDHDVAGERPHREAVAGDMVHDRDEHVLLGTQAQ